MASYGASFKGKGIGHNSMTLGSLLTPHAGVVSENDIKKNKFKAFGVFNGKVELLSYRSVPFPLIPLFMHWPPRQLEAGHPLLVFLAGYCVL